MKKDKNQTAAAQAARSFLAVAKAASEAQGVRLSQAKVAAVVGESAPNFSEAVRGTRGGSLDRVSRWISAWSRAGGVRLVLRVEDGAAWVEAPDGYGAGAHPVPIDLGRTFLQVDRFDSDDPTLVLAARSYGERRDWDALLSERCVVVLGECGTGKTTEFKRQCDHLNDEGDMAFMVSVEELAAEGLEDLLSATEHSRLMDWKASARVAHVFIDAKDETDLRGKTLRRALRRLVRELGDLTRLRLLISSRGSDWIPSIDSQTVRDNIGEPLVVEVAPLDDEQVRRLAVHFGVSDVRAFVEALAGASAQPFVERPLDVEWLAKHWLETGSIGGLFELVEHNVSSKLRENENPDALSAERARGGARRLAAVATLTGRTSIRTDPGEDPRRESAIDPRSVLFDWTGGEIACLLRLGLFDEATYGRVRIHHRTTREYLAAEWFKRSMEEGRPRREVRRLFFRESATGRVVPPHLRACAAWLALRDSRFRVEILRTHPLLLLDEGDPAALDPETRGRVFESYLARYSDGRERLFRSFDRAALGRFATRELAESLNAVLSDPHAPEELLRTALQMVGEGDLEECLPTASAIARDGLRSSRVRSSACIAIHDAGGDRERGALSALADTEVSWEPDLLGTFIRATYPDHLTRDALVAVLTRTVGPIANHTTVANVVLEYDLPGLVPPNDLLALVAALKSLVAEKTPDGYVVSIGRAWLLPALAGLFGPAAALDPSSAEVQGLTDLFAWCRRNYRRYHSALLRADSVVADNVGLRRELFWRYAAQDRRASGRFHTRFYDLKTLHLAFNLRQEDVEWLVEDAKNRPDPRDRLLAFDALRCTPFGHDESERRALLEAVALKDEHVARRFERMAYRTHVDSPETMRYQRRRKAQERRRQRQHQTDRKNLLATLTQIRTGQHIQNLWFLYGKCCGPGGQESDPSLVEELYGPEVKSAFESGLVQVWRTYNPPLPHEKEVRNRTPVQVAMGLRGIELELASGVVLADWSVEDRVRAARYASGALNQFPGWLAALADAHPVDVEQALAPAVTADFAAAERVHDVLAKLPRSAHSVRRSLRPTIMKLLRGSSVGSPQLQDALECVLKDATDDDMLALHDLLEANARAADVGTDAFVVWWTAWMQVSPDTALDVLEGRLVGSPLDEAKALMTRVAHQLQLMVEGVYSVVPAQFAKDTKALRRLLLVLHRYILPNEDVEHESVFSPGPRDYAQWLRNRLPQTLASIPGDESVNQLRALAEHKQFRGDAALRDYFLHLAEQRAASDDPCLPLSLADGLNLVRGGMLSVRGSDELYLATRECLLDIKEELEHGDFSIREMFNANGATTSPSEDVVQKWFARELEFAAKSRFTVHREEEVDRSKKPDIRTHHAGCAGPVSVEVKVAESWSYRALVDALENQLVVQYLASSNSNHGILLLVSAGPPRPKGWKGPNGAFLDFGALVSELEHHAERLSAGRQTVVVVAVDTH